MIPFSVIQFLVRLYVRCYYAIRGDSPAYIDRDGTVFWTDENDRLHKTDGPAAVLPNGKVQWWINGYYIEPEEVSQYFKNPKKPTDDELVIFKLTR